MTNNYGQTPVRLARLIEIMMWPSSLQIYQWINHGGFRLRGHRVPHDGQRQGAEVPDAEDRSR